MNGSNKAIVAMAVLICAVVIIGEMYAYLPNDYGYGSSAELSDGTISYTVENRGSDEYDAILLDNGSYVAVGTVYIYYDPSYASNVNEDVGVEVGAQPMTQEYYIDFWFPSVSRTEISASPSSIRRARMPLLRRFFRALAGRRFTVPFRVTISR